MVGMSFLSQTLTLQKYSVPGCNLVPENGISVVSPDITFPEFQTSPFNLAVFSWFEPIIIWYAV